jgi:hypothetical protein
MSKRRDAMEKKASRWVGDKKKQFGMTYRLHSTWIRNDFFNLIYFLNYTIHCLSLHRGRRSPPEIIVDLPTLIEKGKVDILRLGCAKQNWHYCTVLCMERIRPSDCLKCAWRTCEVNHTMSKVCFISTFFEFSYCFLMLSGLLRACWECPTSG